LKKPALQASLTQLEEQIAQYKKFDQDYKVKLQSEKAEFEKTHTERSSKELEEAVGSAKSQAAAAAVKQQQDDLLLLSQFLKLAAIRRGEDEAAELEESKALEGLLAQVYAGDASAVAAMLNLIQGSSETITSVTGEPLSVTCKYLALYHLARLTPFRCRPQDCLPRTNPSPCPRSRASRDHRIPSRVRSYHCQCWSY